jgi:ATP-dependent RNA helicase DDX19/DBP5
LICTNILARGIDVPEVDMVINYDVPFISNYGFKNPDYANFMHRVGRTGRFGTDGLALTLTSKTDEVYDDLLNEIQKYYSIEIKALNNLSELVKVYEEMRPKV